MKDCKLKTNKIRKGIDSVIPRNSNLSLICQLLNKERNN